MSNVVMIVGETGTGKSTSIKNLNSEETYIINVLNKSLPFKGSNKLYNTSNKNIYSTDDWKMVYDILKSIPDKMPYIKNVIIDDAGFIMTSEFFKRSSEVGLIY